MPRRFRVFVRVWHRDRPSPTVDAYIVAGVGWDGKFHVWDVRIFGESSIQGKKNATAASVDLPGKMLGMDVTSTRGLLRAVLSTSAIEHNVFGDARAASSIISANDKENNQRVCSCTASRP